MASLSTIPQELQNTIFSYLSLAGMTALSITSRVLRRAVLPSLYRSQELALSNSPEYSQARLVKKLRTFLDNPAYAEYVRHATFYVLDSYGQEVAQEPSQTGSLSGGLNDEVKMVFERAIDRLDIPEAQEWRDALHQRDPAELSVILLSLIVAQFPNLRSVRTNFGTIGIGSRSSEHLSWVAKMLCCRKSQFRELSSFTLDHYTGYSGAHDETHNQLPLLLTFIPKLCQLQLRADAANGEEDELKPAQARRPLGSPLSHIPDSSGITQIRLLGTAMPPYIVTQMLEKARKLEVLTYDCYFPSSVPILHLDDLWTGLELVSSTLKELTVRYDIYANEALDVENLVEVISGNLTALRSLTRLNYLEISIFVLYGNMPPDEAPPLAQVLPPRLQHLRVTDDLWGFDGAFPEWEGVHVLDLFAKFLDEQVWRSATPDLRQLDLVLLEERLDMLSGWDEEQQDELKRLCEDQGIRFNLIIKEERDQDAIGK
jgi:hypothetical protein